MGNPSIVQSMAKNIPKRGAPIPQKQAEPSATQSAPPHLPSEMPPKIPSKIPVPSPLVQKEVIKEPSPKIEKSGPSTIPPLSKISLQESFKSLLEKGDDDELLTNWELDPEEKKKVG
jgi:ribosome assembly protein YihI (activator of Der GTPase)